MDVTNPWAQFGIQVFVGTVAGGLSDTVAVWLLFHPRERRFGFQGAIPKNKARLARSIGKMVGERLLTPTDVLDELARSGLREQLTARLAGAIEGFLDVERGSLRESLPPAVVTELEHALDGLAPIIAERVERFVHSAEFEERALRFVTRTREELKDRPLGTVLTEARRAAIADRAAAWAEELAGSTELEAGVRQYLETHASELLASEEPLVDRVPPPVVRVIEGAIDAYLPLAVSKLGSFLHHPAARERIREALHDLFQRFVEDLRFHERVIARLLVTERTFDKAIDSIEHDGVEQLAGLLDDPLVREEITKTINDGVLAYLRKPIAEIVGGAESERARALVDLAGDYLLKVLRAEQTRGFLIGKLDEVMERAESRTWGELLAPLSDEMVAGWLVRGARSDRARELTEEAVRAAIARSLDRPLGRIGRWLPADAPERAARVLVPALWGWMEAQLPSLVQQLKIEQMVERKVLAFSNERLEELIRGVIQRELEMIILTGYTLGCLIGMMTFLLSRLVGI